jgi:hypothetical protein
MSDGEGLETSATAAITEVLRLLSAAGYDFVTPTPATHALVSARRTRARPGNLRDILGWNRPFASEDLPPPLLAALARAGAVQSLDDGALRSTLRVSALDGRLMAHSARGAARDAVFLGPDSYRFVRLLDRVLADGREVGRAADIGVGAGAGALAVAARRPGAEVVGIDVNRAALRYMSANAAHAGLPVAAVIGSGLTDVGGEFDLILANPPYVAGTGGRTYRDGGGLLGAELAISWVTEGLARLRAGGSFVLYTGSPVVEGRDVVLDALKQMRGPERRLEYEELDPDVFGSMLGRDAYADVERIAAVGATLTRLS